MVENTKQIQNLQRAEPLRRLKSIAVTYLRQSVGVYVVKQLFQDRNITTPEPSGFTVGELLVLNYSTVIDHCTKELIYVLNYKTYVFSIVKHLCLAI